MRNHRASRVFLHSVCSVSLFEMDRPHPQTVPFHTYKAQSMTSLGNLSRDVIPHILLTQVGLASHVAQYFGKKTH